MSFTPSVGDAVHQTHADVPPAVRLDGVRKSFDGQVIEIDQAEYGQL